MVVPGTRPHSGCVWCRMASSAGASAGAGSGAVTPATISLWDVGNKYSRMDWAALRAAVEAGGDLNAVNPAADWYGRSTVLQAVFNGAPLEVVKWMHDSTEADFTAVDELGRTAVHMACDSSQFVSHEAAAGVVEYLVSVVGLDPCQRMTGGDRWSPIHSACCRDNVAIVRYLLEGDLGVTADVRDANGWSAVHHAAWSEYSSTYNVLGYLVAHAGADVEAKTQVWWCCCVM